MSATTEAHASLYCDTGATAQTLTTTAAVLTALATAGPASGSANGGNRAIEADTTNSQLDVTQGDYKVDFTMSCTAASDALAEFGIYKNGVQVPGLMAKIATVASGMQVHVSGPVSVAVADLTGSGGIATIDVRGNTLSSTLAITPTFAYLSARRMVD